MRKRFVALLLGLSACVHVHAEENSPTTEDVGYSAGYSFGQRLKPTMPDLDVKSFLEGIRDAYTGTDPRLTQEQMQAVMQQYQIQLQAEQRKLRDQEAEANRKLGESFLASNAQKAGVITTESGLQYRIIAPGEGNSPKLDDVVQVHYTGRLINGEVFDSSVQRGEPVSFPVNGVIKGWVEALQMMKPGAKWELAIPAELAYGPRGTGKIGPNETLIFDVELLKIQKK